GKRSRALAHRTGGATSGQDRGRCRAGNGGRFGRRHDDDRRRTGEAAALCRGEEAHHAGRRETMVLAAKQRSLYELTDAISAKDRVRALQVLDAILSTGEGEEAAIGHLYMLAKTF